MKLQSIGGVENMNCHNVTICHIHSYKKVAAYDNLDKLKNLAQFLFLVFVFAVSAIQCDFTCASLTDLTL